MPSSGSLVDKLVSLLAGIVVGIVLAILLIELLALMSPPQHYSSDPAIMIRNQLKNQVANTYGCSGIPYIAWIGRGTTISAKGVAGTILELEGGDKFTFDVDSSATTGVVGVAGVGPYTVAEAKLTTTGMTSSEAPAFFIVCADTQPAVKIVRVCVAGSEASPILTGCRPE